MTERFFVTGGIYADFSFRTIDKAEDHGPFATYAEAFDLWKAKAFLNIDNALHRLIVERRAQPAS